MQNALKDSAMQADRWILNYLSLAKTISEWSKDPSTKVGAVAVGSRGQILAQGYNGFPRGIADTPERLNNRDEKYKLIVHGEMNCIYNAALNGTSLDGADMYVHGLPVCSDCAKGIIQIGIKRVFTCYPESIADKWRESAQLTSDMFQEAGVEYYAL